MHYKTLHEWGYKFNQSGRIQDLTQSQQQLIALAETAEQYVKRESRARNQGSVSTQSGLENRPSKRKRVQSAIKKHT